MKNQAIVLEGVPGSGKTSLANYLRDKFTANKVNESLGSLSKNSGNQKAIFQDTLDKYSKAKRLAGLTIIDRGYPSLLAWDYCREKEKLCYDYTEKLSWINVALKHGELYEPAYYIYVRIPYQLSFRRRPRKTSRPDAWSSESGVIHCEEFYEYFFSQPEYKELTITVDGTLTTKELGENIVRRMNKIYANSPYNIRYR